MISVVPPDWPHRSTSRIAAVAPHRWHVQEMGQGPDLLLIHGAGGASHSWRGLMPLLAAHYRVLVIDLPGQGFTRTSARGRLGLDPMAEDIVHLCAAQGWHPAALIGHSAGAAVALRLTELLPEPPRALVGLNAALGPFEGVAGWLFPMIARVLTLTPLVPQLFARLSMGGDRVGNLLASTGSKLSPEGVALYRRLVTSPTHVDATLAMMAQWRLDGLLSRLPQIATPSLLIATDLDHTVPAATSRRAAERMPNAEYLEIRNFGHLLHEEDPALTGSLILPFLARHLGA
ncbi:alpha/beta fold hydrolase [Paracoccaceae bacterium Fryx2]|nr:alpha/beta fold hydrolase [Paracoccaceae bacterium Fryx2]